VNTSSEKLFQLKKIIHLRMTKAHRVYREQLEAWNTLKLEVDEMQSQFDVLQIELDKVAIYKAKNKNKKDTVMRVVASDRRNWLIYDQDMIKYDLDVAKDDLEEATEVLDKCKLDWLRAQQREKDIQEQGDAALLAESQVLEDLQEEEVEGLCLSGVSI